MQPQFDFFCVCVFSGSYKFGCADCIFLTPDSLSVKTNR